MANTDQTRGIGKQAKGALKKAAGKFTGNRNMKAEGGADKSEGKMQKDVGDAKEKAKKGIDRL